MTKDKNNSKYVGKFLEKDYNHFKDDLLSLLEDYKRKSERLDKIIKQSDKTQMQLLRANEQLDLYKNSLEDRVKQELAKIEEKEKIIYEQSKFVAMGEMIDAIAHQWTQPLSIINLQVDMMCYDFSDNNVDQKYMEEFQEKITQSVEHMNTTLNEFRTFFRPNKEQAEFNVKKMIQKVLLLIKDDLIKNNITTKINEINNYSILGIENEFKHIVLNLINNSKDAFSTSKKIEKLITINIIQNENENIIEIIDTAGGIDQSVLKDIFKVNVTTKQEQNGTGVGLYISSQIAKKNQGTLTATNTSDGAKFSFIQKRL